MLPLCVSVRPLTSSGDTNGPGGTVESRLPERVTQHFYQQLAESVQRFTLESCLGIDLHRKMIAFDLEILTLQ